MQKIHARDPEKLRCSLRPLHTAHPGDPARRPASAHSETNERYLMILFK